MEAAAGTSYGHLIGEFLELAKANPVGYNYAQIGDVEDGKENIVLLSIYFEYCTALGIRELIIPHPVLANHRDIWLAIPLKHWAGFVAVNQGAASRSGTAVYYAFGKERKWGVTDALEFYHKLFYNLKSTALVRYGPYSPELEGHTELMESVQQGCMMKAVEAYTQNQIQVTLWHQDLWQAAASTAPAFQEDAITWDEALEKIPEPQFWVIDKPLPCLIPTIGKIQEIETGHQDYFNCKMRAMLMFPVKMYTSAKGAPENKWLGAIARLIVVEVPESPEPRVEWTTFALKRPELEEYAESGRLMAESTVRSVTMIEAWALNEFMRQPVIKVADTPPARHIRRQAERAKQSIPKISTVYLRRLYLKAQEEAGKGGEPRQPVEWNFQWLVGMHYREQWYPSENTHKRILILPYWKGDPSKPIKAPGAKVYKVVR